MASAQTALTERDFLPFDPRGAKVGQLLFYDPILSGNRNISCATCHHPKHGTSDGLPLGIGEGGTGLGPERVAETNGDRIQKRIPRNAPGLWNLGAREIRVMFHDGRLSRSNLFGNDFNSPAEETLPDDLKDILATQSLFPLTSEHEMAGDKGDNEVANASRRRLKEAWDLLAIRVRSIPEYGQMLLAANPDLSDTSEIEIEHIVNALSDFMNMEWQSYDSPYDQYLAGDTGAMDDAQARGMDLFFGKAGCGDCHRGRLLSDQKFHALALPQFGPGRTRKYDPVTRDVGLMGETDRIEDAYRFRTPMLRNVAITAPYGHNGAFATLEGIVRHHLDSVTSLEAWTPDMVALPQADWLSAIDFVTFQDSRERQRLLSRIDIEPRDLTDAEVGDIVAFLTALTGTKSVKGRLGRPDTVPSGLRVE